MFRAKIILYCWIYNVYIYTMYDNNSTNDEGIKWKYTVARFLYFSLNSSVFAPS